jgi:hypothetical protein
MITVDPKAKEAVPVHETSRHACNGRRAVADLMSLASDGLAMEVDGGFRPTQLGVTVTFAFAQVEFDFAGRRRRGTMTRIV